MVGKDSRNVAGGWVAAPLLVGTFAYVLLTLAAALGWP
jgi:hypothetical protein